MVQVFPPSHFQFLYTWLACTLVGDSIGLCILNVHVVWMLSPDWSKIGLPC